MKKKPKIIAIVGPTASGKTDLSIKLAKKFNGEIISADSRQIYKSMKTATATPDEIEKQGIVHHLMEIKSPLDDYSVANFQNDAKNAINQLILKGKLPIVSGGTGLYFRILLENFAPPKVAPNKKLREELELQTTEELFEKLKQLDPIIADKIHPNNKVKIIRALEVCMTLNKPMSEAQGTKEPEYDVLWLGLNAQNRDFLYNRANTRVEQMIQNGLVDELKKLLNQYGKLNLFQNTIGYQELFPFLEEKLTLQESAELIKQNTRRYIKRQLSWFRSNEQIQWLNIDELDNEQIITNAENLIIKFLQLQNN